MGDVRSIGRVMVAALAVAAFAGCAREESRSRTPDPSSHRVLRQGEVVGTVGRYHSHVWLGIPYAKPPVGPLRWRAPQPPDPWSGVRQAVAFGSPCVQLASAFGGVDTARPGTPVGSEDCLTLNIYAPRFSEAEVPGQGAGLPVMVWIHGGGNSIGQGAFYNGGNLAQSEDVVVVTLNYRLGPLGWFRLPALRGAGTTPLDQSGNFGTLDLIRALRWVQENIAAFGGDPGKVTIFGESAGGTNVFTLLLSPEAHGLFQRAIVESGGVSLSRVAEAEHFVDDADPGDPDSAGEVLLRLLIKDKLAADRQAAKVRAAAMSATEIAAYLRGKSATEILSAYPTFGGTGMLNMPKVFRDGVVLPDEDPLQRFARPDGYNRVPVVLGTNRDENKLFMFNDPHAVRRFLWIFPRLRHPRRYNLSAEYLAKMWKATGADEPAAAMRGTQGNVFVYRFDWDEEPTKLGANLSVMLGAAHGFEIPFVFGHFDLGRRGNVIFTKDNEPGRLALSAEMMSYWANFAYTGSPGRGRDGRLPDWTAWDNSGPKAPKFLVLDTAVGGGVRMSANSVTRAGLLAAVDEDPRLPTQKDKCRVFHDLVGWSRTLSPRDYPNLGKQGCKQYPFDEYPWGD